MVLVIRGSKTLSKTNGALKLQTVPITHKFNRCSSAERTRQPNEGSKRVRHQETLMTLNQQYSHQTPPQMCKEEINNSQTNSSQPKLLLKPWHRRDSSPQSLWLLLQPYQTRCQLRSSGTRWSKTSYGRTSYNKSTIGGCSGSSSRTNHSDHVRYHTNTVFQENCSSLTERLARKILINI